MSVVDDWVCHLRASGKAERTIEVYRHAAENLVEFLAGTDPAGVGHKELEKWIIALANRPHRRRPGQKISKSYVSQHYRAVQQFCRWLCEIELEIDQNPFDRMRPPVVSAPLTEVLSEAELIALLKACDGAGFNERRDMAVLRLFIDTGARRAEVAELKLSDIDLAVQTICVLGKGNKLRIVPFGLKTSEALRQYLRKRSRHLHAESEYLWIGQSGPLIPDSVRLMLNRRADQAGVPHVHPHKFRHTFAHRWLAEGNGEVDLMRLCGWSSRQMLERYGAAGMAATASRRGHHRGHGERPAYGQVMAKVMATVASAASDRSMKWIPLNW